MATSLSVTSASAYKPIDTKAPIRPNLTNTKTIPAAPMEPISKATSNDNNFSQSSIKPLQECLTHVIDGHVIHESSQPFPLVEEDGKGRNRKKSETKVVPPTVNLPAATTVSSVVNRPAPPPLLSTPSTLSAPAPPPPMLPPPVQQGQVQSKLEATENKKRGPGRPPGSTKQSIETQRLLQQQQQKLQGGDIVKVSKDGSPVSKKPKTDFESGPPSLTSSNTSAITPIPPTPLPPTVTTAAITGSTTTPTPPAVSEVKSKYNIDVVLNNPLKWTVKQVCDFVKNLPGCSDYVEDFQLQEIDGQALMLLKADHLMSAMAIKLGPALKICNAIEAMREELKQN